MAMQNALVSLTTMMSNALPVLFDASLKGSILLVAAGLLTMAMRRASAAQRHLVWLLALSSTLAVPIFSVLLPAWRILPRWADSSAVATVESPKIALASPPPPIADRPPMELKALSEVYRQEPTSPAAKNTNMWLPAISAAPPTWWARLDWGQGLVAVWALGMAALVLRYLLGMVFVLRLGRESQPVAEEGWLSLLGETARALVMRRHVTLLQGHRDTIPMTWGILRPVILLPKGAKEWPVECRRLVLSHELAHVKRRDCLTQLIAQAVSAVYWFNPLVWLAWRCLLAESELACDDSVLAQGSKASDYAEQLLTVVSGAKVGDLLSSAAIAMARPSQLQGRLLAILDERRNRRRLTRIALVTALLIVIGVVVPLSALKAVEEASGESQESAPRADAASSAKAKNDNQRKIVGRVADVSAAKKPAQAEIKPQKEILVLHKRPQGHCSLAGKVIAEATGRSVPGARICLLYMRTYSAIFLEAAGDGTFVFKDIPAGPHLLHTLSTPGFQDVHYNPENMPGFLPQFSLKEGEQRGDIVLKAKQARHIAGKVLNEDGKSAREDGLVVWTFVKSDDGTRYRECKGSSVNRDGTYGIDGLGDKPVYVMAINSKAAKEGHAYPPIFYPSTFSRSQATLVTFDKGPRVENIDITRQKAGGLVIAGTIHDEAGKPIPEAFVIVTHRDMQTDFNTAYSDAQGHYEVQGVGDGQFLVHVNAIHRGFVRTAAAVNLDGHTPKTQCDFTLTPGVLITGKLIDKRGNAWEIANSMGGARVVDLSPGNSGGVTPTDGFDTKYVLPTVANAGTTIAGGDGPYSDGQMRFPTKSTFVIQGMTPGHTVFHFMPQAVAEIRYDGRDIKESGIDTKPGQEIKNVAIVIGKEEGTAKEGTTKKETPKAPVEMVYGERPRGNCSISGKVVSAATGEPVAHTKMYLFYMGTYGAIFVDTAGDGTFTLADIPKGPFALQLSHAPGYQDVSYDPEGKSGQFPQFSLKDGEHRSGIVLKANHACRISGKILAEKGKILEHVGEWTVLAWTKKDKGEGYTSQQSQVNPADGSYLIDCLDNKPAYVMAINWIAAKQGNAYPPIYYPGVFSRSDAKLITFDEKPNVVNIDITLKKEGGLILEGTVLDEAGKPVPEAFVAVHRRDLHFDFVTAYTDAQGRYRIQGLGDGEFLVHVDAVHRGFVRTRTPVDLNRKNKTAHRDFTLNRGALISGKFVDEQGNDWQIGRSHGVANIGRDQTHINFFSLSNFRNKYRPQCTEASSGGTFAAGEGDYQGGEMIFPTKSTFVVQGMMPGKTTLDFSPMKEGQKVVKILCHGQNIMESGIETKPGQEIKDVTIVIGKK